MHPFHIALVFFYVKRSCAAPLLSGLIVVVMNPNVCPVLNARLDGPGLVKHALITSIEVVPMDVRPEDGAPSLRTHHQRWFQVRKSGLPAFLHVREIEVERENACPADIFILRWDVVMMSVVPLSYIIL